MKNHIRIHLPAREYFGGDIINGIVELNLSKSVKNRGVRVIFRGFEYCMWLISSKRMSINLFTIVHFDNNGGNSLVGVKDKNTFLMYKYVITQRQPEQPTI